MKGRFSLPTIRISRNQGVIRDNVRFGNLIEQLAGNVRKRFFGISSNNGIEREDVRFWGLSERVAGSHEAAAFGVEEDEVVGEVG